MWSSTIRMRSCARALRGRTSDVVMVTPETPNKRPEAPTHAVDHQNAEFQMRSCSSGPPARFTPPTSRKPPLAKVEPRDQVVPGERSGSTACLDSAYRIRETGYPKLMIEI